MRAHATRPGPRRGARASGDRARQREAGKTISTRTTAQAQSGAAVYDGLVYAGDVTPRPGGRWLARDGAGRPLGDYGSRRAAEAAVWRAVQAARTGGAP